MLLTLALACAPEPEPELHDTLHLATSFADQGVATWAPEDTPFDWIPTVWHFGLLRLHDAGAEGPYEGHVVDWIESELPEFDEGLAPDFTSSDSMSPALLASELMRRDASRDYTAITDHAHAYLAAVPKTSQGGIPHWGQTYPWGTEHQMWLDSLFMWGLFLLSEAERTGDPAHKAEWIRQYLLFSELCRDPADQLYLHAWDDQAGATIPDGEATYWARGNSWVLVSAAEAIARYGVDDPDLSEVVALYQAHAAAIASLQEPDDGLWHTVINEPRGDDPANYTETSAAALIVYGLSTGVQAGALDEDVYRPVIDAGVRGLRQRARQQADGSWEITGTSFGTNTGDYDYYTGIPVGDDLMLGVGAAVMATAAVHGTPKSLP